MTDLNERAEFCHVAQRLDDTSSNVDLDVTVFGARDRRRDCEVAQAKSQIAYKKTVHLDLTG